MQRIKQRERERERERERAREREKKDTTIIQVPSTNRK